MKSNLSAPNEQLEQLLASYHYDLPRSSIAQKPSSPRDAAKLLVYHKKSGRINVDVFRNLSEYLPSGAVLVFNETKVIPARLGVKRSTGGNVALLYVAPSRDGLHVLANRALRRGEPLFLNGKHVSTVRGRKGSIVTLSWQGGDKGFMRALAKSGVTPLPPYLRHSPLSERERRQAYQTVFARVAGSIAAPTASLHFTKRLLASLKKKRIDAVKVTLHVNLGTFAPLTAKQVRTGILHEEKFSIAKTAAQKLNAAKRSGRPVIAVGTTVARTLEAASDPHGMLKKLKGDTGLFIREGYARKFVDGLITNFHVPQSSLMMLVAAFTGRKKLLSLYALAIRRHFRFFSFGDGMLIM